ncbi:MAG: hypothetical protein QXR53_04575 [Candidatus Norongarragalinales archaeon]
MSMHRIFWLSISGKRMHLLKLAGAFFVLFSVLMVANAAYNVFVTVDKINTATLNPKLSEQLFGWALSAGRSEFSSEDALGILLAPIAWFMFWLGLAVMSLIVYQSGKVIVPIEEYEQTLGERHRQAFQSMVRRAKR